MGGVKSNYKVQQFNYVRSWLD